MRESLLNGCRVRPSPAPRNCSLDEMARVDPVQQGLPHRVEDVATEVSISSSSMPVANPPAQHCLPASMDPKRSSMLYYYYYYLLLHFSRCVPHGYLNEPVRE
eukprot:GHVU01039515.1.p2 GENE.GHVU01039515.1~~GHVU01039515.1.p2  ORF type:complete len:110 (-),score=1.41 GHVU01039515.1:444-752(-)